MTTKKTLLDALKNIKDFLEYPPKFENVEDLKKCTSLLSSYQIIFNSIEDGTIKLIIPKTLLKEKDSRSILICPKEFPDVPMQKFDALTY